MMPMASSPIILFLKFHFTRIRDSLTLSSLHIYLRTAIFPHVNRIKIGILFVLHADFYTSQSFLCLRLLVAADTFREVQSLASAVRHLISASDVWQVRNQRVVSYLHSIAGRHTLRAALHRIHTVNTYLVLSFGQRYLHFGRLLGSPRGPFFCSCTSTQHHQCQE